MSFAWWKTAVPTEFVSGLVAKTIEVERTEIRARAALLGRLGRTRAEATASLRKAMEWEHWKLHRTSLLGELETLVDEAFKREGK